MVNKSTERAPGFGEALNFWLKLGFISFGGPAGQIAIMHEFLVEKKKWISPSRFFHALNYCMLLPGPEAQQLATYIGWLLHGTRGGLTAGILFILPSIFILLLLSIAYVSFGHLAWVSSLFYGLKPAVVAIIILALFKIGHKSLLSPSHYIIAALSFLLIFLFNVPFPLIIVGAIIAGIVLPRIISATQVNKNTDHALDTDEHQYFINRYSHHENSRFHLKHTISIVIVAMLLWLLPLVGLRIASGDFDFWYLLSVFFTKAAFVTFGGAYAVLPYVAQVSVEKFHWLSQYEMIDGLALGETTPGPLIMVLAFVGFMAGYNRFGTIAAATTGLLLTTFYTFLPCFLFILAGAPLVERTKENKHLKVILSYITASVVGVILNLTIYFGKAVVLSPDSHSPDWFAVTWLIVSLPALYRFKANMILWIVISALAGFLYLLITGNV